jgi:hypothetical protein
MPAAASDTERAAQAAREWREPARHARRALLALAPETARTERSRTLLVLLALGGAALFYGDSMITPAISVLSAVGPTTK